MHILFSVATDVAHAPNGGTLLVDFVRFEPNPFGQTNALGFPLGYETFGVVPRTNAAAGREPYPLDQVLRNLATPYDAAPTLMALLNRGDTPSLAAARMIADTFVDAFSHDNHGDALPATNGAVGLHNGNMGGDIALFNSHGVGAGQQGDIRLADFSCGSSPTGFCVLLDGATGGNNAFAVLALASAYKRFGDTNYVQAARTIGHWIVTYLRDSNGTGYGGYFLGYGSTNIGNYCYNDSWGMIFVKGQSAPLAEGLGSGQTFPSFPVHLYATFPRTVPRPVMSVAVQQNGGGLATYTLTVTNVVPSRDIEIQYSDAIQQSWQHLRTLNNPPTNVVQTSDFIMFSPARYFKTLMDGSVQLPPGF
jgi:hypothetical protein